MIFCLRRGPDQDVPFFCMQYHSILSLQFLQQCCPWEKSKYLLIPIKRSRYCLTLKPLGVFIPQHITRFCLDREFTGKKYTANPKTIIYRVRGFIPSTSSYNESNWHNASTRTRVQIYWTFVPIDSVPSSARVILKFCTNNKNYSSLSFSNKAILNS